ncbi:MAG: hypothetical protein OXJ52_04610 [Oligoflexia bacterium]|nr:hypothetical protein [Oligoflexia bacterium]
MLLKNSQANFKEVIEIAKQKQEKSLFVFDMDSTLFCMKYRTQALIDSCLENTAFCEKFKLYLEKIKEIQVTETDWSIPEIMSRYGFHLEEEIVTAVYKIWRKGFFSNNYLYLDRPYKDCVNFVQYISQLKAQVYYLTARNYNTMYEGTVQSLKQWNFPLKQESCLIMKKDSSRNDADYKTDHLQSFSKKFDTILFFENEPVILNKVAQQLPQIHLFWMNSAHSRQESPPKTALALNMKYSFE